MYPKFIVKIFEVHLFIGYNNWFQVGSESVIYSSRLRIGHSFESAQNRSFIQTELQEAWTIRIITQRKRCSMQQKAQRVWRKSISINLIGWNIIYIDFYPVLPWNFSLKRWNPCSGDGLGYGRKQCGGCEFKSSSCWLPLTSCVKNSKLQTLLSFRAVQRRISEIFLKKIKISWQLNQN